MSQSVGERVKKRHLTMSLSHARLQEELDTKQRELRKKKVIDLNDRFKSGTEKFGIIESNELNLTSFYSYQDPSEFPSNLIVGDIYLDKNNKTVFLPFQGYHLPIHLKLIKTVVTQDLSDAFVIKFQFKTNKQNDTNDFTLPNLDSYVNGFFIKELQFTRCSESYNQLGKQIRDAIKYVYQNPDPIDSSNSNKTDKLILLNNHDRILLRSLNFRSNSLNSKKAKGTIELHFNGFRYSAPKLSTIDILFNNISHAFFCPMQYDLIAILHFELKNPIIIDKHRIKTIQVYNEMRNGVDDVEMSTNYCYRSDFEEMEAEQKEIEERKKITRNFENFIKVASKYTNNFFQFEQPNSSKKFTGVPTNSNVTFMPTRNCLVSLYEWPSTVIELDKVEIVSFERVCHGLKQFDAIFVYRDYSSPVTAINSIPVEKLDMLKDLFNSKDLVWYECKNNLNWPAILKHIRANILSFIQDNGFESFMGDGDVNENDSKDESNEEEDEDYIASDEEDGSSVVSFEEVENLEDELYEDDNDVDEELNSNLSDDS